jgi:hypothetical protein
MGLVALWRIESLHVRRLRKGIQIFTSADGATTFFVR